jgi:hypothetical protein
MKNQKDFTKDTPEGKRAWSNLVNSLLADIIDDLSRSAPVKLAL